MTRPAVIIGLGGTGQWVLTYLKKDLLELNDGKMPENVRLLAFDTVSEAEAQKATVGLYTGAQAAYEKAPKRIGTVQLEKDVELVHIGGDCYDLVPGLKKGRYPQLDWFDAEYWERTLSRDNWILDRGAGRFRQFGLLAVYKDLMGGHVGSQILKRLPRAINEVLSTVEGDASFEVIVVASVAGGTGSAMLVPFGVLARQFCAGRPVRTRAIVVLPSAFSPGQRSEELELRGGAALRELARAMMVPEGVESQITFVPGIRDLERISYSRPFDGIYFIDGMKGDQPITTDPKYGVFPAVAGWIRQILDDKAGMWFTNYVVTNRAGAQYLDQKRMAEGVFGVFGVYSLYTPERTLRQTYRLKLAKRLLEAITLPEPGSDGRLVPKGLPRGVPEPSHRALAILQKTARYEGEEQPVTLFFSEVASIVQQGGAAAGDLVTQKAEAGCMRPTRGQDPHSWLATFTALPEGSRYDELRQEIDIELQADFRRTFVSSDQTKPPRDPASRQRYVEFTDGIEAFIREHYGGMGADGPDDYGSFGDVIRRTAEAQVDVFRNVLRLNVNAILSEDHGRLGYAIHVLRALERYLELFLDFMEAVARRRGEIAPRVDLAKQVQKTREQWNALRNTRPTLLERMQKKPSDRAVQAERAYLGAYDRLIRCVREEILHNNVEYAARHMLAYTRESRQELERWAVMLLEGDRARDINGLLSQVQEEEERVLTTIREDRRSEEVERLVQVQERESEVHESDVAWALEGIRWEVKVGREHLEVYLHLNPQGVEGGTLSVVHEKMSRGERRATEQRNLEILGRVVEQRFGQVQKVRPLLEWCQDTYPSPEALADEIVERAGLLTSLMPGARPGMEAFSVSVNKERDPQGFTEQVEKHLRRKITGGEKPDTNHPVEVLDAEDPYRLTAVRTWVGLLLEDFQMWERCQEAYEQKIDEAQNRNEESLKRLVQELQSQFTRKEEKEAVALEIKWRSKGWSYRVIHPRFVSLLGQRRRLDLALQCWALGWVQDVQDEELPDQYHWELRVPGWEHAFWLTPNKPKSERLGAFEALEHFVLISRNYARGRRSAQLDWSALQAALRDQWKDPAEGEGESPMQQAAREALADGGLVSRWREEAGYFIDEHDREAYRNPVYRDLADYAQDYFEGLL